MKDTISAKQRLQPLQAKPGTIRRAVYSAGLIFVYYAIFAIALTLLTLNT